MEALGLALDELEPIDRRLLISLRRAASERVTEPSEELLDALCAIVSSMGAERPVHNSKDDAPWKISISTPLITLAPTALASFASFVSLGL